LQEANGTAYAVARIPAAAPARTFADVEILEHDGIAKLEHLRIGQSRVGHVRMHGVGARKAGTCRRARANRLVILVLAVSEMEIVNAPRCGGGRAERADQAVGHGL